MLWFLILYLWIYGFELNWIELLLCQRSVCRAWQNSITFDAYSTTHMHERISGWSRSTECGKIPSNLMHMALRTCADWPCVGALKVHGVVVSLVGKLHGPWRSLFWAIAWFALKHCINYWWDWSKAFFYLYLLSCDYLPTHFICPQICIHYSITFIFLFVLFLCSFQIKSL